MPIGLPLLTFVEASMNSAASDGVAAALLAISAIAVSTFKS